MLVFPFMCVVVILFIYISTALFFFFFSQNCDTVFDLISGLFAYVILGQKNALFSEPPEFCLFVFCKYCKRALCNLLYLLCTLRLSLVQNATSEDRCMSKYPALP